MKQIQLSKSHDFFACQKKGQVLAYQWKVVKERERQPSIGRVFQNLISVSNWFFFKTYKRAITLKLHENKWGLEVPKFDWSMLDDF